MHYSHVAMQVAEVEKQLNLLCADTKNFGHLLMNKFDANDRKLGAQFLQLSNRISTDIIENDISMLETLVQLLTLQTKALEHCCNILQTSKHPAKHACPPISERSTSLNRALPPSNSRKQLHTPPSELGSPRVIIPPRPTPSPFEGIGQARSKEDNITPGHVPVGKMDSSKGIVLPEIAVGSISNFLGSLTASNLSASDRKKFDTVSRIWNHFAHEQGFSEKMPGIQDQSNSEHGKSNNGTNGNGNQAHGNDIVSDEEHHDNDIDLVKPIARKAVVFSEPRGSYESDFLELYQPLIGGTEVQEVQDVEEGSVEQEGGVVSVNQLAEASNFEAHQVEPAEPEYSTKETIQSNPVMEIAPRLDSKNAIAMPTIHEKPSAEFEAADSAGNSTAQFGTVLDRERKWARRAKPSN